MLNSGRGIRLRGSARTNVGQVRENNEDNIHLWANDQVVLAVVADGMGGAAAGEEASRIAIETITEGFPDVAQGDFSELEMMGEQAVTDRLRTTIRNANLNIVQRAVVFPEYKGMGTTVTLAFVRGTHVIVAHVGDSRAYLVDGQDTHITQITADHSFVEALLAAGHITAEQAEDHPMRNVLYRALGQGDEVDIDVYYSQLRVGDRLVLCSDGLTRHVKSQEIATHVMADEDPANAVEKLIDLTNSRGGEDNVSVIVIKVEQDPTVTAARNKRDTMIIEVPEETDDDTVLLQTKDDHSALLDHAEGEDTLPSNPVGFSVNGGDQSPDVYRADTGDNGWLERHEGLQARWLKPPSLETPNRMAQTSAIQSQTPIHTRQQEAEGEGRDTSAPEQ